MGNEKKQPSRARGKRYAQEPPKRRRRDTGSRSPRRKPPEPLNDGYYYHQYDDGEDSFQDISSYSSPQQRRQDQRAVERGSRNFQRKMKKTMGKRRMSAGKKVGLAFLALVLAFAGLFAYMFAGLAVHPLRGELGVNASVRQAGVKNIALFGLDSRDGENQGRSDAVMILTVDSRNHTLKMASLMRDSYVNIEGYGYDKLAHAYAYGGPELAIRTINQGFQLDIEDYVTVNFYEMADIVDAFGGVELELTGDEMREVNQNLWNLAREAEREGGSAGVTDKDYFTAVDGTHNMIDGEYVGGRARLNGRQAVAYSRIRYIGDDQGRTSRQHQVLMGLISQAKQRTVLSYPAIIHGIMPHCETSLDLGDVLGLVPFALGRFETETAAFPGEEENAYGETTAEDMWVYCYDEELAVQHLHDFIFG